MRLLIISYFFPPYNGGAIDRIHNFTKYLPEYDVSIDILTVNEELYEFDYRDYNLLNSYDYTHINIHRVTSKIGKKISGLKKNNLVINSTTKRKKSFSLKKFIKSLILPDEYFFFIWSGFSIGKKILSEQHFDYIFATTPPFSSIVLAKLLSIFSGIPFILDYRDLLSINPFYNKSNSLRSNILKKIERWAIKNSHKIIFTNKAASTTFLRQFKFPENNVVIIPNGADLQYLPIGNKKDDCKSKIIIFSHIGSLTKNRTPKYFLEALNEIVSDFPELDIRVELIGFVASEHISQFCLKGESGIVKLKGVISKEEAINSMINSDILLIFQRIEDGGKTAIPGKIYEYLACGIPTIVMDEGKGATSTFMSDELNLKQYIAEYMDVNGIKKILNSILSNLDACKHDFNNAKNQMINYDRRRICEELVKTICNNEN